MAIKKHKGVVVFLAAFLLLSCFSFTNRNIIFVNRPAKKIIEWDEQLNLLNYLIIKASSINLIHGLYLSKEQIEKLIPLAAQIDHIKTFIPSDSMHYNNEIKHICITYQNLIKNLLEEKPLTDSIKNSIYRERELESEIIKRSLLAAQMPGYHADDCMQCHAPPEMFPTGDISNKNTKIITAVDRKEIDLAHVKGLFGEQGTLLLWNLRDQVDEILTDEQKFVFSSFRCCLVPQEDPSNPGIFGQSFVTNEWIEYFRKIRALDEKDWQNYKSLFIMPLSDIIEAKLPGIKKYDKKRLLSQAEIVISDSRKMDAIDFELQKENLCRKLSEALSIDIFNGESSRLPDERKFIAAMFLLFPGNINIYLKLNSYNKE
mgnify:CR=1 FL=1